MRKMVLLLSLLCAMQLVKAQGLTVSPSQLNFGIVTESSPDSLQITVSNNSGHTITITGYRFYSYYNHFPFSSTAGSVSLPGGASQSLWIRFAPQQNVFFESELFILNDGKTGALRVDLKGQGRFSHPYYAGTENTAEEILKDSLQAITGRNYFNAGYVVARDSMFMSYDNEKVNGQGAAVNTIECVYTGRKATGYIDRTDCQTNFSFNTEHTFPQGFFNSLEPMRADLYHLYPTDDLANNIRASLPFGIVSNPTWQQGGSKGDASTFEPRDLHKGRVARAMMYFVMRYQNYTGFMTAQEGILRQWHQQFPVDNRELVRSNKIALLQLNRNPFVDYPQFIERITSLSNLSVGTVAASADSPTDTIDFGFINAVNPATYTYWLMNDGNQPFTLSNLTLNPQANLSFINGTGTTTTVNPGEAVPIQLQLANAVPGGVFTGSLLYSVQGTGLLSNVIVPIRAQLSFTGMETIQTISKGYVFPNPASETVCVSPVPEGWIRVYDLNGKEMRVEFPEDAECNTLPGDLSPGVYVLEWISKGAVYRSRWSRIP